MGLRRRSLVWIAVSFLVVLAAILGGQRLFQAHAVERPLTDQLMATAGVIDCRVASDVVEVTLGPVPSLLETRGQLESLVHGYRPQLRLVVRDGRDFELSTLWRRLSFVCAEGLATGRFVEMVGRVEQELGGRCASYRLEIDDRFLYVTLEQDGAWLYEVITRPVADTGGAS